ncbi:hypothetical protein MATL_G00167470 [Megalops atlanticus]|uniref:Uncharacterized protein n=1 Tax=Megalops atlanticus TaxID=7932 RepID=A0A9D3PQD1_MEGAT|nr:hypothetical protein MATL_G00167470 [Megalops atlanticus]
MTMTRMVIRAALGLSCLFLAHCSSPPVGSEFTGPPSAPRPCVLLQASTPNPHPDLGELSAGGVSEGSGGWQWGSAGAQGSLTVAQGCVLTLWGEQGGHQSFPSGTRVPLEGWERPLALHCSCEEEEGRPLQSEVRARNSSLSREQSSFPGIPRKSGPRLRELSSACHQYYQ